MFLFFFSAFFGQGLVVTIKYELIIKNMFERVYQMNKRQLGFIVCAD